MSRFRSAPLVACLALASACGRSGPSEPPGPAQAASSGESLAGATPARPVVLDFVRDLDMCALGHRGVLLDFGDPSMSDAMYPGSIAHAADDLVEHEGATWLRVRSRTLSASFYWPAGEPSDQNAYVEGRIRGLTARAVAVAIDGKPVGTWTLTQLEARIVVAHARPR